MPARRKPRPRPRKPAPLAEVLCALSRAADALERTAEAVEALALQAECADPAEQAERLRAHAAKLNRIGTPPNITTPH